jgi:choline kinase
MKSIVLAAGAGRRLASMGWEKPKSLLEFNGITLLDNIILSLIENGIDNIVIVVGYKKELIIDFVGKYKLNFTFIENKDYAQTNTINSLWLARDYINEDYIYFNADVFFDRRIIPMLVNHPQSAFAIDVGKCADEEVKVIVDKKDRIVSIGKKLNPKDCLGEFIGIGKFSASVCPAMVKSLCRYNEILCQRNLFFETAVNDILNEHSIKALPIGDMKAVEIDCPEDYQKVLNLLSQI